MIKDGNTKQLPCPLQPFCQRDVIIAWLDISARVVVSNDHRHGVCLDRLSEHIPRMNCYRGSRPHGDHHRSLANRFVASVEGNDQEAFLLSHHASEAGSDMLRRTLSTCDPRIHLSP